MAKDTLFVRIGVKKQTKPTNEKLDFVLLDSIPCDCESHWEMRDQINHKLTYGLHPFVTEARKSGKKIAIALFVEWEDESRAVISALNSLNQLEKDVIDRISIYCGYFPGDRGAYIWEFSYAPSEPLEEGQRAYGG